jgi:hypothetical protein
VSFELESGGGISGLLAGMALGENGGRTRKLLAGYAIGTTVYAAGKKLFAQGKDRFTFTVTVSGDDALYPDVQDWVLDHMPSRRRRSIEVRSTIERTGRAMPVDSVPRSRPRKATLRQFYDGGRTQTIAVGGYQVQVGVEFPTLGGDTFKIGIDNDVPKFLARQEKVTFTCVGEAARDAVIAFLAELADVRARADAPPSFYMAARWGGWDANSGITRRSLDSVVLRAGQVEGLVDDIGQFLTSEADYVRLGVPYHRGYLFEGPPGVGKTSIAKALATHFDLDVYFLPLGDLGEDTSLLQLVSGVRPRSMLLIEDIDVAHAAQDRAATQEDETKRASLSGLLNALDGFATPHGLITVMTTNRAEVLDSALVRPGRVDRLEHIGYIDDRQLRDLVQVLVGADIGPGNLGRGDLAPAAVVDVVKANLHDREAALVGIKELVREP